MFPVPSDPAVSVFNAIFNPTTIDTIFHYFRQLDEYEKTRRYDDNQKKFVEQALRMFEAGQLTKDQLKAVIDLIPSTVETQARPVTQTPRVDLSTIDLDAILKKLSQ